MVKGTRRKNRPGNKRPKLEYFYLGDDLHRRLFINRGTDTIKAWNYPKEKMMVYVYSDVLKRQRRAFTTKEVGQMLNRGRRTLEYAIINGMIERPQVTYGIDENKRQYQYMWSEKDIMALHAYLSTVHLGRPRKDGEVVPMHLPTPRELRAMINDENVLYIKQGDTFIPSWRAKDF